MSVCRFLNVKDIPCAEREPEKATNATGRCDGCGKRIGHMNCPECGAPVVATTHLNMEPGVRYTPPTLKVGESVPPAPPTLSEARSLIGLIEELASLVVDHRAMGIGEVSIANAIRALYMDRWLDQWCNSVEAEPLEESLIDRIESRRSAVRTLMLENAESERTVVALRAEVSALTESLQEAHAQGYRDALRDVARDIRRSASIKENT